MSNSESYRPRGVGYTDDAFAYLQSLGVTAANGIHAYMQSRVSSSPYSALTYVPGLFHAFFPLKRGKIIGYRIDYKVLEMMIFVEKIKPVYETV